MCGTENIVTKVTAVNKCSSSLPNDTSDQQRHSYLSGSVINLDQGDPSLFQPYWKRMDKECTMVITGSQAMSYISDVKKICWFMEAELEDAIKRLHRVVGNAVVDDRYVVVGTGSTQLYQAVLYALTSPGCGSDPIDVVCAAPYYSQYPEETDLLRSGLYRWGGDAHAYNKHDQPYIEVVTSPNNPDGNIREPVVKNNGNNGKLVYDLAYYWPQYTPITQPADYDIMYFTFSKSTGHAGSRIGWAFVKDEEIARKMVKFIEYSSIGVSKDSQLRAAKIMGVICESYQDFKSCDHNSENFFEFAHRVLAQRWERLRDVIQQNNVFTLPNYPPQYCIFNGNLTQSYPAFAWLKCNMKEIQDCEKFLREEKMLVRGGRRFGSDPRYARVSMVCQDQVFKEFLDRLMTIKALYTDN